MKAYKKFSVTVKILVALLITSIWRIGLQPSYAKASSKKYYVKKKYLRDIGREFQYFKKKYGWTLTDGEFTRMTWFVYWTPNNKIMYTFDSHAENFYPKMKNTAKCVRISMKAKDLVKGFKGKMNINTFVSRLDSKKKKASWSMGGQLGTTIMIPFYPMKGKRYYLELNKDSKKDFWISGNEMITLLRMV